MHVLLAPDKFKGCLSAAEVAAALEAGLHDARPGLDVVTVPVADGGDGTVAAALSAGFTARQAPTVGPTGEPLTATYAVRDDLAVLELASVVGLARLPGGRPDPLGASSYGLGRLLGEAVDGGARQVVLGLGGSASTDGGAGLVQALGGVLRDRSGARLPDRPDALDRVASVELAPVRARLAGVRLTVASDVDHPLLGPNGAAAVFGPQKGATADQVARLEDRLRRWSAAIDPAAAGRPGAGAAGGAGYAALAVLGATLVPGIDLVLDLVGFADRLAGACLVVTGEGSLDAQSLGGKVPVGVARAASAAGVPVLAVAGRSEVGAEELHRAGIAAAYPLSDLEPDRARSIATAPRLLRIVGRRLATEWLP